MRNIRWAFAVASCVCVSAVAAQDPVLKSRLDAATYAAVSVVIDSAKSAGIPTQALVSKALEGSSKGASGERIVGAVRRLAGQLTVARGALGPNATAAEINAGATALHIGVSPDQLASMRAARPRQPLTVPLGMLADLVARGVPTDSAGVVVLALARANMRDEDFVAFRRNVERDIALGAPPAAAAMFRVNSTTRAAGFLDAQSGSSPNAPPVRRKP